MCKEIVLSLFILGLGYITYRDLKERIIPDWMIGVCLTLGVLWRLLEEKSLLEGLIGAGVMFCLSLGCSWGFYKLRGKIGLGGGDIKLLSVAGLWLGGDAVSLDPFIPWLCPFMVVCCLSQIVLGVIWQMKTKDPYAPFGPILCGGLAGCLMGVCG